jgi:hypothetical protein
MHNVQTHLRTLDGRCQHVDLVADVLERPGASVLVAAAALVGRNTIVAISDAATGNALFSRRTDVNIKFKSSCIRMVHKDGA